MKIPLFLLAVLLLSLSLGACGQKGALYLPDEEPALILKTKPQKP